MEINGLTLDWVKTNPLSAFNRILELETELADMAESEAETGTAYFILASTGCSCCSNENELLGPYRELDGARRQATWLHSTKYLASQYAPNGLYSLYSAPYEKLPDGRLIIGGTHVTDGFYDESCSGLNGHPDSLTFDRTYLNERIG
jgi:hypothetical protein